MKLQLGQTDIFFPVPAALIVGAFEGRVDIATIAWVGMVSSTPPTIGVSFDRSRYSLSLIRQSGSFTVNIPSADCCRETDYCGIVSGKKRDKASDVGFTYYYGTKTETPIINECPFNLECRVVNEIELGNYIMLLGEIVETYIDENKTYIEDEKLKIDVGKVDPIVYCATVREYWKLDKKIGDAFSEGKKVLLEKKVNDMDSERYFKEVANQWDAMRKGFFSEAVRDKACSAAAVKEGELAADIGAGTGFITEGLLQRGLRVIAVDRSEEMLSQMKQKFKAYKEVDYRQGEAENLPIENEMVDYAMANMYLHHVDDPMTAINEMVRIIKPGGKLVITDLDEHSHEFLKLEHHDRWMGFKREDVKEWFIKAGLRNVTIDCAGGNCCAQSSCSSGSASISIFIASGEK